MRARDNKNVILNFLPQNLNFQTEPKSFVRNEKLEFEMFEQQLELTFKDSSLEY